MNPIATELLRQFEPVVAYDFYRDVFLDGELDAAGAMTDGMYTAIAVEITDKKKDDGAPLIRRYTVTDDLDVIDELQRSSNFCILAPISYVGKSRKSTNARIMYALVVELDNLRIDGERQIGLELLVNQWSDRVHWIPKPTYIVASGTGVHLYYVFHKGIPLFRNVVKSLEKYKRQLTKMVWNQHVTRSWRDEDIQQESVFQAFRMVGTRTKKGEPTMAFKVGAKVSIEYMNSFLPTEFKDCAINVAYKSNLSKAAAKQKYPEWYERRVEKGEGKGHWICNRAVYDWWKRRIREEVVVGHRYYALMLLSVYAIKCDIDKDELTKDCFEIMEIFEERTDNPNNHFTVKDVVDALQSFEDRGLITYPINSISSRSGLHIEKNKRNYRKQDVHLKIARFTQELQDPDGNWRNKNGAPTQQSTVKEWQRLHPDGKKAECIRETGLSKTTVYKWWTS